MIPDRLRSPRLQAGLLAFVLLLGLAKVAAYDPPPGVSERDAAQVAAAARARGAAKVDVRLSIADRNRVGARMTGTGVASFGDGRSRVTIGMPGVVTSRFGAAPEYEVRAAAGRGYVRPIGADGWASFPEAADLAPGLPTAAGLLTAIERYGPVRRSGGGDVRGVACDRYEPVAPDPDAPRFALWVGRDGLPRRVEWVVPYEGLTATYRIELYGWGVRADVEIPAHARDVGSPGAALRVVGSG